MQKGYILPFLIERPNNAYEMILRWMQIGLHMKYIIKVGKVYVLSSLYTLQFLRDTAIISNCKLTATSLKTQYRGLDMMNRKNEAIIWNIQLAYLILCCLKLIIEIHRIIIINLISPLYKFRTILTYLHKISLTQSVKEI